MSRSALFFFFFFPSFLPFGKKSLKRSRPRDGRLLCELIESGISGVECSRNGTSVCSKRLVSTQWNKNNVDIFLVRYSLLPVHSIRKQGPTILLTKYQIRTYIYFIFNPDLPARSLYYMYLFLYLSCITYSYCNCNSVPFSFSLRENPVRIRWNT